MVMMNKKSFLLLFISGLSTSIYSQDSAIELQKKRPNILLIIVDDLGWRDLQPYGSTFHETPHLQKFSEQSLLFSQAYATYPRCVPSRYSLMTGTHPARLKGDGEGRDGEPGFTIRKPNLSIGEAMKEAGYATFFVGKWHLGEDDAAPSHLGFDQSIAAGKAGATRSHFAPYNVGRTAGNEKEMTIPDVDSAPPNEYLTDRLTDETIRLLQMPRDQPFFGVLSFYAVHTPLQGKEPYVNKFTAKKTSLHLSGPDFEPQQEGETKLKQDNATYAAMLQSVDEGIGKILAKLKSMGIDDKTLVIITSDHGGLSNRGNKRELATSNKPLRAGKGHLYEGGLRVPLMIHWPGITRSGSKTNSIVQGVDLFPTLMDVAGRKTPPHQTIDGYSFIDVLTQNKSHEDRVMFWHNGAPRPVSTGDNYSSAIRSGDFKLIDFYGLKKQELYDIRLDPGEHNNLVSTKSHLADSLLKVLINWRKKVGADMRLKPGNMSQHEKAIQAKEISSADDQKFDISKVSLKEFYKEYFPIGTAINPKVDFVSPERGEFIARQFNSVTPENQMKPKFIHPEINTWNWDPADQIVQFAVDHNMKIRGHVLVWQQNLPSWMRMEKGTMLKKDVMLQRMKDHIYSVMRRYKNSVYAWDVVNEAVSDRPGELYRPTDTLYKIAGEDYIEMAFRFAREADPSALLFYNDYRFSNPEKRAKIFELIKRLKSRGVPIDGIGIQSHYVPDEITRQYLQETIDMFNDIGLQIQVTELDVSVYNYRDKTSSDTDKLDDVYTEERRHRQANMYRMLFDIYRKNKDKITGVTFWGATDLRVNYRTNKIGKMDYPFLFDEHMNPKSALKGVLKY